jgi:hypothetical protein
MYNQEVKSWLKIIAMNQAATNPLMQTTLRIHRTLRILRIHRTHRTPRILRTPRIPRTHRRIPIQEVKTEQRTVEQETLRMHLLPTAKIHRTPTPTAKILLKTTHLLSTVIN